MSITIAKEMKNQSFIRLPNLYSDLDILKLINNIFYKAYGTHYEYAFIPEGIEECKELKAEYYIETDDLVTLNSSGYRLLDNICTHVTPYTKEGLHRYSHKRKTPALVYQMSMEQLKRILFITEHMNIPISHLINTMFLENQVPHVYTIKNLRYPFIGLTNEYSK